MSICTSTSVRDVCSLLWPSIVGRHLTFTFAIRHAEVAEYSDVVNGDVAPAFPFDQTFNHHLGQKIDREK